MKIELGKEGLANSFQAAFPEETKCANCSCIARIAFVGQETTEGPFVCDLHKNDPHGEGLWPHDAIAVAVYFCKSCLEATALYNQA